MMVNMLAWVREMDKAAQFERGRFCEEIRNLKDKYILVDFIEQAYYEI